jgi:hypothetical protein
MGAGVYREKERGDDSSFALDHACMPSPVHLWHWVIEFLPHITHSINWDVSQKMSGDCLQLNVYHLSPSTPPAKCWVSMRELIRVMVHYQQENMVNREGDDEVMVPIQAAISLLTKVEMEDFSIAPTINALK